MAQSLRLYCSIRSTPRVVTVAITAAVTKNNTILYHSGSALSIMTVGMKASAIKNTPAPIGTLALGLVFRLSSRAVLSLGPTLRHQQLPAMRSLTGPVLLVVDTDGVDSPESGECSLLAVRAPELTCSPSGLSPEVACDLTSVVDLCSYEIPPGRCKNMFPKEIPQGCHS